MSNLSQSIAANKFIEYQTPGRFLRLMNCTGLVEIVYYRRGAEITRTGSVLAGYAEKFDEPFDMFRIYDKTGAANAVELLFRLESSVSYDRSAGSVDVTSLAPSRSLGFSQGSVEITNASAQIVPARNSRTYLLIQNNSDTGTIFLNLIGVAATVGAGVRVGPGGSLELNCNVLTRSIFAIGDIANNPDVVVVEG